MSGQHARLSASAAHRWLQCAGSIAPGGKSSFYAAQGTYAHDIAAKCLTMDLDPNDFLLNIGVVDGHKVECDLEMVEVIQSYLDAIAEDEQPGDQSWVEMPLLDAMKNVDPDLGGTADYVRYRPSTKHLKVVDFKYGSGMFVDVDDNPQLKLYGLGAMLEVDLPVVDVEVVVVQPRFEGAKPVRSWSFKGVDILNFVADVQEAAERTREKNPVMVAGDHCGFCPRAATCPELEKRQHDLIVAEFCAVETNTDGKIEFAAPPGSVVDYKTLSAALTGVALVEARIKAIKEFAYGEALKGAEIPGFKLVDKVPRRKWKSEGDVIEWAQKNAIEPWAPKELLSPAQLEKRLGENAPRGKKKAAGEVLVPFVEKVSSGTALVPLSDDRPPAKRVTAEDFAAIPQ